MNVIICTNHKVLKRLWAPMFEKAGIPKSKEWDEHIACEFSSSFAEVLMENDIPFELNSSARFWAEHQGHYVAKPYHPVVAEAYARAVKTVEAWAQQHIDEVQDEAKRGGQ